MPRRYLPKPLSYILSGGGLIVAGVIGGGIGLVIIYLFHSQIVMPLKQVIDGAEQASPFLIAKLIGAFVVLAMILGWLLSGKSAGPERPSK